jgi:hypothetical protein
MSNTRRTSHVPYIISVVLCCGDGEMNWSRNRNVNQNPQGNPRNYVESTEKPKFR